jgi:hypothetical protein
LVLAALAFSSEALAAPPRHAIEIEFPTELELTLADTAPVPLRARWVRGETSDQVPGPVLQAWVNFGTVAHWHEDKGVWLGEWQPPKPAVPGQLALVVSALVKGRAEYSAQQTPVSAEIELPGHSEAGAQVTILVAGEKFGPVPAASDGHFKVRVRVPPGVSTAIAQSRDALGNTFKRTIDLFVPKISALALVCPSAKVAAGESLPVAVATDRERAGGVVWTASRGAVSLGVWHAPESLTLPAKADGEIVSLTATSAAVGANKCAVEVVPAAVYDLRIAQDPPFLPSDGRAEGRLLVTVLDRFGNATREATVQSQEDKDAPLALIYDETTRAFTGLLRSRQGVEQRTLQITAPPLSQAVVVEQIPARGVALHAQRVANGVEVTVTPPGAAGDVRAVDDQGVDVPLLASARTGVLITRGPLSGVRFVSFTHVPSGVSVLLTVVPK